MCSPTIAIPMAMQIGGGLYSASNQIKAGKDERNYYNMSAANDEAQAKIVKIQGDRAVTNTQDKAAFDDARLHDQVASVEGSQKVALAANGVGAGSTTAEDIARDTMTKAAKDEALIRYNADSASDAINKDTNVQVMGLNEQARQKRYAGKMAVKAAKRNAFSTIFGTAAQVAPGAFKAWKGAPKQA